MEEKTTFIKHMKKFLLKLKDWFKCSQETKEKILLYCGIGAICAVVYMLIAGFNVLCDWVKSEEIMKKEMIESTTHNREAYIHRLESKFDSAREALATEIDKYINTVAPNADIDALNLIDLCDQYNVDIRLALAQGHIESHFGTKGTAARTNSVFNVGAYDGHSADKQIKNGFGYKHPDYSIEPYLKLLTSRYLIDGKTEQDLLDNFVDKNGKRYASSTTYEAKLKAKWTNMDSIADISKTYGVYKKYKLKLGR